MEKCSKCGVLCAEDVNEATESETESIIGTIKENGEVLCIDCFCKEWGKLVEISPIVSPRFLIDAEKMGK